MNAAAFALVGVAAAFSAGVIVGIGLQKLSRRITIWSAESALNGAVDVVERLTPHLDEPFAGIARTYVREMREADGIRTRRRSSRGAR